MSSREAAGGRALRVLFVDRDPFVSQAFCTLVGTWENLAARPSGGDLSEILDACSEFSPHLALVGLGSGSSAIDGIRTCREMRKSVPQVATAICTSSESPDDAARAWMAGINAFLNKKIILSGPLDLYSLLLSVLSGVVVYHIDPRSGMSIVHEVLSDREKEVLRLKAARLPHRVIANELCISLRTVDSHLANIKVKLGASSIAEAIAITSEHSSLVDPVAPLAGVH